MIYEKNLIESSLHDLKNQKVYLRETYINNLIRYSETNEVIVVLGQRRSGKSYIIAGLIQKLGLKDNIFYFNKEADELNLIKESEDLTKLFNEYCENHSDPERIVIDEIQDISGWERFIRARYSAKKYKIIISGSNSRILDGELATYLTGRYLKFNVYPLGYEEYLEMSSQYGDTPGSFSSYMELGGLPETIMLSDSSLKKNYIKNVVDSIVLKDILQRHQKEIRNIALFPQLLNYLSNVMGSIISIKNISDAISKENEGAISSPTIGNYVNYITESYIIYKVPRYNIIGKQLFQQKDKYYFNDIGIRNSFGVDMLMDRGKILENIVFLHLKRLGYEVYVGEINSKEIDFVAKKGEELHYIQVAWLLTPDVEDREFGNLLSIRDGYGKHVVSYDALGKSKHKGISVWNIETFLKDFK